MNNELNNDPNSVNPSRQSVTVFGLGNYYKKLRDALWKSFQPVALVDIKPANELNLNELEKSIYYQMSISESPSKYVGHESNVCFILTPNNTHFLYLRDLLSSGQTVFIEKPFATTLEELDQTEELIRVHPDVYFSDFYSDVRIIPLLWFLGMLPHDDLRNSLIVVPDGLPKRGLESLGAIKSISGRIIEKDPLDAIAWRAAKQGGGVLFDLMIHLLAALRSIFPEEELQTTSATLMSFDKIAGYQPLSSDSLYAESKARVEGILSNQRCHVSLDVAKNASHSRKELII